MRDIWTSDKNEILSVCEKDFKPRNSESTELWSKVEGDVSMVHSTTSSHYSVFRQRIPDHDLKHVRNYIQFKNRLEGMELMLDVLKRSAQLKEV